MHGPEPYHIFKPATPNFFPTAFFFALYLYHRFPLPFPLYLNMESPDNPSPDNPAGNEYRKWMFAKYVARYFPQARHSKCLGRYFELVVKLYQDRWPDEVHDSAEVENSRHL